MGEAVDHSSSSVMGLVVAQLEISQLSLQPPLLEALPVVEAPPLALPVVEAPPLALPVVEAPPLALPVVEAPPLALPVVEALPVAIEEAVVVLGNSLILEEQHD